MLTISELKKKTNEMGTMIGIKEGSEVYPIFDETSDINKIFGDGVSIYIADSEYNYVVKERNKIIKHITSTDVNDILYAILKDITFSIAIDYEKKHRNKNEDFRRQLFDKQLDLLARVRECFAERRKMEIDEILKISPYRDSI